MIIVQCLARNNKSKLFLLYLHNKEWLKYFVNFIFKGKKLMQWLESPYSLKVLGSNLFLNYLFHL
jgi:hypothetical protein